MNTFLPYPNFAKSAKCLDRQRLCKQRVECVQLLKALFVPGSGWANHPCTKMWRGYEVALAIYGTAICTEWVSRGYKDTCMEKIAALVAGKELCMERPPWLGSSDFHSSHRSNLLRKDSVWYGQFGWTEPYDLPYIWPSIGTVLV